MTLLNTCNLEPPFFVFDIKKLYPKPNQDNTSIIDLFKNKSFTDYSDNCYTGQDSEA